MLFRLEFWALAGWTPGAGAEKKVLEGLRGAVWVRIVYKMI
jgi:hypothetical protein